MCICCCSSYSPKQFMPKTHVAFTVQQSVVNAVTTPTERTQTKYTVVRSTARIVIFYQPHPLADHHFDWGTMKFDGTICPFEFVIGTNSTVSNRSMVHINYFVVLSTYTNQHSILSMHQVTPDLVALPLITPICYNIAPSDKGPTRKSRVGAQTFNIFFNCFTLCIELFMFKWARGCWVNFEHNIYGTQIRYTHIARLTPMESNQHSNYFLF